MANIILTDMGNKLEKTLEQKTFSTLQKLQAGSERGGLHVEPIHNSADDRIRSVRVDQGNRLLVFKIVDEGAEKYIYAGTYAHDEAYAVAEKLSLHVNALNGVLSFSSIEPTKPAVISDSQKKADEAAREAIEKARRESEEDERSEAGTPAPEKNPPAEVLAAAGHTVESLRDNLGLDEDVLTKVFATYTHAEFDAVISDCALWERDALIGLASGLNIDEIRKELDLDTAAHDSSAESSDEKVARALKKKATKMSFREISGDELQNIIENGTFAEWTTFLHPTQEDVATRSLTGSGRVSGGAGTGKTVVLLHRTREILRGNIGRPRETTGDPRVLLTTFTKTLAANLDTSLSQLDPNLPRAKKVGQPGVAIAGIDSTAMSVLNQASPAELEAAGRSVLGEPIHKVPKVLMSNDERSMWDDAIDRAADDPEQSIFTQEFLSAEYEAIVLAGGITTRSGYLKANRAGRGTALNRKARSSVWKVIETYVKMATRADTQTFPVISALAAAALDARTESDGTRMLDHVIVDEGQDFHAGHWRLIRALVAEGDNDIFIAEDSHQRIYGQPLRLSHFDIKIVGRARRLTLNYRTTSETLGFAMQILGDTTYTDGEGKPDEIRGYRSARSGPSPVVLREKSLVAEIDVLADQIRRWLAADPDSTVGVLLRHKGRIDQIKDGLEDRGITVSEKLGEGVNVLTMHSSKGLEFQCVALFDVTQNAIPGIGKTRHLTEEDREFQHQQERSLLYVASSRARDELVVTHGKEPSELLPAASDPETSK